MNNIEAVRLYQTLSTSKFDGVQSKDDRFALLDIVLTLSKAFEKYADAEKTATETIDDVNERNEYMSRLALSEYTDELPTISKDSVYELIDSNKSSIALGAVSLLSKLVKA